MGLEAAEVDFTEEDGIFTNEFLETTSPNIYALGDCLALANSKE